MENQIQQKEEKMRSGAKRLVTVFAADGYLVTVKQNVSAFDNIKPKSAYPRVFVWDDTVEETVLEQVVNRRNRPQDLYRLVAEAALGALGYDDPCLKWSQKAGCTCPCSPGFIAQGDVGRGDIHITFENANRLPGLSAMLAPFAA